MALIIKKIARTTTQRAVRLDSLAVAVVR